MKSIFLQSKEAQLKTELKEILNGNISNLRNTIDGMMALYLNSCGWKLDEHTLKWKDPVVGQLLRTDNAFVLQCNREVYELYKAQKNRTGFDN